MPLEITDYLTGESVISSTLLLGHRSQQQKKQPMSQFAHDPSSDQELVFPKGIIELTDSELDEIEEKFFSNKPTRHKRKSGGIITVTKNNNKRKKKDNGTRVVKLRRENGQIKQGCDVYIGRRVLRGGWNLPQSKWANPFVVTRGPDEEESRMECIKNYRTYVEDPENGLIGDLHELKGKVLGCFCKPKACHGDVLVELIDKYCP